MFVSLNFGNSLPAQNKIMSRKSPEENRGKHQCRPDYDLLQSQIQPPRTLVNKEACRHRDAWLAGCRD